VDRPIPVLMPPLVAANESTVPSRLAAARFFEFRTYATMLAQEGSVRITQDRFRRSCDEAGVPKEDCPGVLASGRAARRWLRRFS